MTDDLDIGGASRDRTDDPLLAKQVLSQLSYGPLRADTRLKIQVQLLSTFLLYLLSDFIWWVWVDLNHRPHPYQGCALTN